MTDKEFTKFITSLKLTDVQISELVDVSIPTARNWKQGKRLPSLLMRPRIIQTLKKERFKNCQDPEFARIYAEMIEMALEQAKNNPLNKI